MKFNFVGKQRNRNANVRDAITTGLGSDFWVSFGLLSGVALISFIFWTGFVSVTGSAGTVCRLVDGGLRLGLTRFLKGARFIFKVVFSFSSSSSNLNLSGIRLIRLFEGSL
jgi:hypothetical protein